MNKRKRRDIVFVCVVFVMTLLGILGYRVFQITNHQGQKVQAEVTKTEVKNQSSQELITVHSTFYNYRMDNEITSGLRNQGAKGLYAVEAVPFTKFNSKLNSYYKANSSVKSGIYTGNFYNYYQNLLTQDGKTAITWPKYTNFCWAANIANRGTFSSVCQGIVNEYLKDFEWDTDDPTKQNICSGTLVAAGTSVAVPYFKDTFLQQKIDTNDNHTIGEVKSGIGFPFRKAYSDAKGQYYEFDSTKDVVRFLGLSDNQETAASPSNYFGSSNQLEYYYKQKRVYIMGSDRTRSSTSQFFPYNKGECINVSNSNNFSTNKASMQKIDYGFGLRLDIPFRLSADGKVDGKNMVFEFSGDDDVWIYVDGRLVMDLGGQHAEATGKINFAGSNDNAVVTVNKVTFENGSTTATDTAKSNAIMGNDTYSQKRQTTFTIKKGSSHEHVLTVFYMERGMYDSNFKMAFNFVPKDDSEVAETQTPTPTQTTQSATPTPQPATRSDSFTIQNKVVTPSRLNRVFENAVWETVEEDVFQYSVENKGTGTSSVGDSGLKYPSGKLTVRQRDGCEKKYLSFGEKPKVRIYFDLKSAQKNASNFNLNANDDNNAGYILTWTKPYIYTGGKYYEMTQYGTTDYYYYDLDIGTTFRFSNNQKSSSQWGPCYSGKIEATQERNGALYSASYVQNSRQTDFVCGSPTYGTVPAASISIFYSQNLPYQTPGVTSTYKPDDASTSSYQSVSKTTYQITEAYPAATASVNANILYNDATGATRNTGDDGKVSLWSDDAATFFKQFAEGSTMRVRYEAALQKSAATKTVPNGTDISEKAAEEYISYAENRTENEERLLNYYYNTSVAAVSKETATAGTEAEEVVKINEAAGTFAYKRVNAASTGDVQITETFTHTVKTGDLYIYKELSGLMEDDANTTGWKEKYKTEYEFTISFSTVFGGNSALTPYDGSATLYERTNKDSAYDNKGDITISGGKITLTGNQYIVISGVPVGTTYTITESDPGDASVMGSVSIQYTADNDGDIFTSPVYSKTGDAGITTIDKENRTIIGVIPGEVIDEDTEKSTAEYTSVDVKITFTNQWGAITISKELAGEQSYANDRIYSFLIEVWNGSAYEVYNGDGVIRTETKTVDETGLVTTTVKKEKYKITAGVLQLKAGQVFNLGELTLTENKKYRISEIISNNAIYECSQIKENGVKLEMSTIQIAEDSGENIIKYSVVTNNGVTAANPNYDYIFINKFYEPYITIEKYYDKTYYVDDEKYYAGQTYADLTGAEQTFLFTVEEYTDAGCTSNKVGEFAVVLSSSEATEETVTEDSKNYNYKISKKIKVNADHYYKVTEDTGWSWKYTLQKVVATGSYEATADNTLAPKYAIIKGTRDDSSRTSDIAKFYNTRKSKDEMTGEVMPEGDTHIVTNKIEVSN